MPSTMPAETADPLATLRKDLDELVSSGYVTRLPGDRYTLTPKGLKAARDDREASQ